MKSILLILIPILITSCATTSMPRGPSEYLLSADRGVTESLHDVRRMLEANQYEVAKEDLEAGFLLMKARRFSIDKGGSQIKARQTLQVRQEGGSVKIRMVYECKNNQRYGACQQDDEDTQDKIARLEVPLLEILRPVLMSSTAKGGSAVERNRSKDIDAPPPLQGF